MLRDTSKENHSNTGNDGARKKTKNGIGKCILLILTTN